MTFLDLSRAHSKVFSRDDNIEKYVNFLGFSLNLSI